MSTSENVVYPACLKNVPGGISPSGEPPLDAEGNVISYSGYKTEGIENCNRTSRNLRLDGLGQKIPTAGEYGIEHVTLRSDLQIPPECFLYDEDRPWVLGKLNPSALDVPEPAEPVILPQHVLDRLDALEAQFFGTDKKTSPGTGTGTVTLDNGNIVSGPEQNLPVKEESKNPPASPVVNKIKSRNASVSPAKRSLMTGSKKSSSPSPCVSQRSRGASPKAMPKIVTSAQPGSKKIMNAKVDLEIIDKKN